MKSVLELFYDQPCGVYSPNSDFVRYAKIKNESLEMLNERLDDEQKQLLEDYFEADSKIEEIVNLDKFNYAFHLGAQLMAEMIEGRKELLK